MEESMQYREYGSTGLRVSAISFGAMRIPFKEDGLPAKDRAGKERNAIETIAKAKQLGINHIDTARGYGNSEKLVGLALKELGRDSFYISTKIQAGIAREKARRQIAEACQKMGVSHIDIVDVHGINTEDIFKRSCAKEGTVRGIYDAIDDGVVSFAGFSSHAGPQLLKTTISTGFFQAASILYWFTYQRNAPAVELARQRGCGILILSPTEKSGMLTTPAEKLTAACTPFSPLELAHHWLLAQDGVTTIAAGAAHPDELEPHCDAVTSWQHLESEQHGSAMQRFEDIERAALGSTRCSVCYECMPCPHNVQIPEILRLRNLGIAFDMHAFGRMRYNLLGNAGHWFPGQKADKCLECGACLKRCPENLDIPALLRQTHSMLQGEERERIWDHSK